MIVEITDSGSTPIIYRLIAENPDATVGDYLKAVRGNKNMITVSAFDGISCGQEALIRAIGNGWNVDTIVHFFKGILS